MKISIKEKTGMISKAIIFQIAMSLFGLMITSAIIELSEAVLIFAGIFSILFYFALIGGALNEDGLKDNIRVTHGRAMADPLLGLKYIALSYIPSFAVSGLYIVLRLCGFGLENVFVSIINMILRLFISGMYLGIDRVLFADGNTYTAFSMNGWSFLIYQVFSVLVCGFFYWLGLKGINLMPKKNSEE